MPLYILGFMGMSRRMEHYNVPEWQPFLLVAALGAVLVLLGIVCIGVQLLVSVRDRKTAMDITGDPWNGRTLEWATASPPAPYNFAVIPQVEDIDAFADMKIRGVADLRPTQYEDIHMPKNSAIGLLLGGMAFVLGFAMVWHIWWLAIACLAGALLLLIIRSSNDDNEFTITAGEVEAIEKQRRYTTHKIATDRPMTTSGLPDGQTMQGRL